MFSKSPKKNIANTNCYMTKKQTPLTSPTWDTVILRAVKIVTLTFIAVYQTTWILESKAKERMTFALLFVDIISGRCMSTGCPGYPGWPGLPRSHISVKHIKNQLHKLLDIRASPVRTWPTGIRALQ